MLHALRSPEGGVSRVTRVGARVGVVMQTRQAPPAFQTCYMGTPERPCTDTATASSLVVQSHPLPSKRLVLGTSCATLAACCASPSPWNSCPGPRHRTLALPETQSTSTPGHTVRMRYGTCCPHKCTTPAVRTTACQVPAFSTRLDSRSPSTQHLISCYAFLLLPYRWHCTPAPTPALFRAKPSASQASTQPPPPISGAAGYTVTCLHTKLLMGWPPSSGAHPPSPSAAQRPHRWRRSAGQSSQSGPA